MKSDGLYSQPSTITSFEVLEFLWQCNITENSKSKRATFILYMATRQMERGRLFQAFEWTTEAVTFLNRVSFRLVKSSNSFNVQSPLSATHLRTKIDQNYINREPLSPLVCKCFSRKKSKETSTQQLSPHMPIKANVTICSACEITTNYKQHRSHIHMPVKHT